MPKDLRMRLYHILNIFYIVPLFLCEINYVDISIIEKSADGAMCVVLYVVLDHLHVPILLSLLL